MTMVAAMQLKPAGPVAAKGASHAVVGAKAGFDAALLETGVKAEAARPGEGVGARKSRKDFTGSLELPLRKKLEEGDTPAERPREVEPAPKASGIDADKAASPISIMTIALPAPPPSVSAAPPRSAPEAAPNTGVMKPLFKAEWSAPAGRSDQATPREAVTTGQMWRAAIVDAKATRHLAPVTQQVMPERLTAKPDRLVEQTGKPAAATPEPAAVATTETKQDAEADGPATQIANVVTRAAVKAAVVAEQSAVTAPALPEARIAVPTQTLKVELSPAGLGAVVVSMRLHGGALDLRLSLSNAQGVAAVERERDALVGRLKGGGYVVEALVIEQDKPAANILASDKGQGPTARDAEAQSEQGRPQRQDNSRRHRDAHDREAEPHRPDRDDGLYL